MGFDHFWETSLNQLRPANQFRLVLAFLQQGRAKTFDKIQDFIITHYCDYLRQDLANLHLLAHTSEANPDGCLRENFWKFPSSIHRHIYVPFIVSLM